MNLLCHEREEGREGDWGRKGGREGGEWREGREGDWGRKGGREGGREGREGDWGRAGGKEGGRGRGGREGGMTVIHILMAPQYLNNNHATYYVIT